MTTHSVQFCIHMPTLSPGFIPMSLRCLQIFFAFCMVCANESSFLSSTIKGKSPCKNSMTTNKSLIVLGALAKTLYLEPLISLSVISNNGLAFLNSANASLRFSFVDILGSDI